MTTRVYTDADGEGANPDWLIPMARRALHIAFVWNDHTYPSCRKMALDTAEECGIKSFEDANTVLKSVYAATPRLAENPVCWSLMHKDGEGALFADCVYDSEEDARNDAEVINGADGHLVPVPLFMLSQDWVTRTISNGEADIDYIGPPSTRPANAGKEVAWRYKNYLPWAKGGFVWGYTEDSSLADYGDALHLHSSHPAPVVAPQGVADIWPVIDRMIIDAFNHGADEGTLDMLAMHERYKDALKAAMIAAHLESLK